MQKKVFLLVVVALIATLFSALVVYGVSCFDPTAQSSASICEANSSCQYSQDSWGSWCEEKGCWNYDDGNASCVAGGAALGKACTWVEPSGGAYGWCEPRSCSLYDDTDTATCENAENLTCVYDTTNDLCNPPAGCKDYSTNTTCDGKYGWSGNACYWDSSSGSCYEESCPNYDGDNASCLAAGCSWNSPYCKEVGCGENNDPTSCDNAGCYWSNETSGWCEEAQCWLYDNITLGGAATADGCVNNSLNLSCAWNATGGWCYTDSQFNCSNIYAEKECFDTFYCFWNYSDAGGNCVDPMQMGTTTNFFEAKNPGCFIFSYNQTECEKVVNCTWNAGLEQCEGLEAAGVACANINDSTMCNDIPMLSTCCEWTNACQTSYSSDCWDQMEEPPEGANYCEDYNSYDNEQLCNQIAGPPWFMPCSWDNSSEHCQFRNDDYFGVNESAKVIELDNKKACESAGGQWLVESYCEGTTAIPAGRCEPKYDEQTNCNKACFACEYEWNGTTKTNYSTVAKAVKACNASTLGCSFSEDSTAPNGLGYCKIKSERASGIVGDCDSDCAGCTFLSNPQLACDNSKASCKWAPAIQSCVDKTEKTCSEKCDRCYDATSCTEYGRGNAGACTWSNSKSLCEPSSGSTEVCWNGIDDDDNGNIDCDDSACYSDPGCGGDLMGSDCFLYTSNTTCLGADGCAWMKDSWGGWCDMKSAICGQYDGDSESCLANNDTCDWWPSTGSGKCEFNWSIGESCQQHASNSTACTADVGNNCTWVTDQYGGGWCEYAPMATGKDCWRYNNDSTACDTNASCSWFQDDWGDGGWCDPSFTSVCTNNTLQENMTLCNAHPSCQALSGFCDPIGFGGGDMMTDAGFGGSMCWMYNGNETNCLNQTGCAYMTNPMGTGFCDTDKSCYSPEYFSNSTACEAAGCLYHNWTGQEPWMECYPAEEVCFRNQTLQNDPTACNNSASCTWRQGDQMGPGHCEPDLFMENTTAGCVGAGGVWLDGFCEDAMNVGAFDTMEKGAPVPLAVDDVGDALGAAHTDLTFVGMKDLGDEFGFGGMVSSLQDSAICNGQYMSTGQQGQGVETTKFYVYLDTDGERTGGCAPMHTSSVSTNVGYEFRFSYKAEAAGQNSVSETHTAYRCSSGSWVVADISVTSFRAMMCGELGGPMLAVDKGSLMKFPSLFDPAADIRILLATADNTTNVTVVSDEAGPGWYTPGAVDFEIDDVFEEGANSGAYEEVLKQGFVTYEDCLNGVDDDDDNLVDCADYDCMYAKECENDNANPLNNAAADTLMPKIVGVGLETYPDGALVMYDTNKPANGTLFFYHNDSTCGTLNSTVYDVGITKSDTVREYKVWHAAHINDEATSLGYALDPATKYYYKLKICDPNGKCAQSKCSSFKTAPASSCKYCNFVTRLKVPTGWYVSYDVDQDGAGLHTQGEVCGADAGMKTNYTGGRHVDVYLYNNVNRSASNASGIVFRNATLTKSALNSKVRAVDTAGSFTAGTQNNVPYAGLPEQTRDKIINSLHPEVCWVQFPKPSAGCTELWHCDDDISSCTRSSDATLINGSGDYCLWTVPYCEFSVWAGGDASDSGSPGSPGSPGGSGGSGGGAALDTDVSGAVATWGVVMAGETVTADFSNEESAVDSVTLSFESVSSNVKLGTDKLSGVPPTYEAAPVDVLYQYVKLSQENVLGKTSELKVNFFIPNSWFEAQGVDPLSVKVFHGDYGVWDQVSLTRSTKSDGYVYTTKPATLGYFAIGGDVSAEGADGEQSTGQAVGEEITGHVVDVPTGGDTVTTGVGTSASAAKPQAKSSMMVWLVLLGVVMAVAVVVMMAVKKKGE